MKSFILYLIELTLKFTQIKLKRLVFLPLFW